MRDAKHRVRQTCKFPTPRPFHYSPSEPPSISTVATYQTLLRGNRLSKFDPEKLKVVIVDEAHHAAAPSYAFRLGLAFDARLICAQVQKNIGSFRQEHPQSRRGLYTPSTHTCDTHSWIFRYVQ